MTDTNDDDSDSDGPTIRIRTPQFERGDDIEPVDPPTTADEFTKLRQQSRDELQEMGLRLWDGSGLMLLPHEWYPDIPEGVTVTSISGETDEFSRDTHGDDKRFGVLPYGIVPDGDS